MTLTEQLMRHEGLRLQVYDDATGDMILPGSTVRGIPTIGYGRNLLVGLSEEEARLLLENDINRVRRQLTLALPWIDSLSEIRQRVLIDMGFNLGIAGLLKFKATLAAIQSSEYAQAADQMRKSKWAKQVKGRAERLARMMERDTECD